MYMIHVHLRSTGYLVSTDRYSVLGYLVLIITKFSTFMYLVSKIYFIRKTDIKGALAATLSMAVVQAYLA